MQRKHWRSRWREGIQPRETPNKPPCSELRIGRNASHVACTACVKLPADQPAVGARSKLKFTALLHHVNEDCLTEAFFNLKKSAAVGVDGLTWHEYERNMEERIADLQPIAVGSLLRMAGSTSIATVLPNACERNVRRSRRNCDSGCISPLARWQAGYDRLCAAGSISMPYPAIETGLNVSSTR